MKGNKVLNECLKALYGLVVGGMVFLFFCLMLDVFGVVVAGGWNPLLGSWPIFSGTVGALLYGSWGAVLSLVVGVGAVARIILWDRNPSVIAMMMQPND